MLKKMAIISVLAFCYCTSAEKSLPVPDENSYFPLLPGSYWKYESEIDHEISSEGDEKRTVETCVKTDSGYIATVRVTGPAESARDYQVIYFCNSVGHIFKRHIKQKKYDLMGRLHPNLSDTLVIDGQKSFYSSCCETCDSTCLMLQNFDMDGGESAPTGKAWYGTWFVKGVGIVTTGTSESGLNLIEYRIGNGPVVKKRWASE